MTERQWINRICFVIALMSLMWRLCGVALAQIQTPPIITDLDWSSDGSRIAVGFSQWKGQYQQSCGDGDEILLVDASTGQLTSLWRPDTGCSPSTVDFNATGTQILVASASTFELWDLVTGKMIGGVQETTLIHAAIWNPTGTEALVTGLSHVQITYADLIHPKRGFLPPRDPDFHGLIYSVWSPDGERVASSIDDGRIYVWDATDTQILLTFEGHDAPVKRLAWNPVSNVIASGDDNGTIWIWDANTGQPIRELSGHTGIVYDVTWHPNGLELASAGEDHTVRVWDAVTGEMRIIDSSRLFSAVAYSPDGTKLAYAGEYASLDTKIEIVSAPLVTEASLEPTAPIPKIDRESSSSIAVHMHPQDDIVGMTDGIVFETYTLDYTLLDQLTLIDDPSDELQRNFVWSPDGSKLAVFLGDLPIPMTTTVVQIWDMKTSQKLYELSSIYDFSIAWSPDGTKFAVAVATAPYEGVVRVHDTQTGHGLIDIPGGYGLRLAWSPQGDQLITGVIVPLIWSAEVGQRLGALDVGFDSGLSDFVFSPTGNLLALVNLNNSPNVIEIWNTDSGQLVHQLLGHTHFVTGIHWSTGGLVSSGVDDTIRIWDPQTGEQIRSFQVGLYPEAELNADGTRLLVKDRTTGIHTRDAVTGEILAVFGETRISDSGGILTPDSPKIATASRRRH